MTRKLRDGWRTEGSARPSIQDVPGRVVQQGGGRGLVEEVIVVLEGAHGERGRLPREGRLRGRSWQVEAILPKGEICLILCNDR
jgi:hypothetical protein